MEGLSSSSSSRMLCSCRRATWLLPFLRNAPAATYPCHIRSSSSSSSLVCQGTAVKLEKKPQAPALTQRATLEISKKRWLNALSPSEQEIGKEDSEAGLSIESDDQMIPFSALKESPNSHGCGCVLGIDPDVSGALAVIRCDDLSTVEVFDVPSVHVVVGSQNRRRHDARSITELLKKLNAPPGSIAYLEQSMPLPKDGKQGWWGSGFGFGIWIGSLVASGFTVVPVAPAVWKRAMEVSGDKDNSRESASLLFPSLSSQLKRKKDHGRAEALLIAAYGKGIAPPAKDIKTIIPEGELVTLNRLF